MSRYHWRERRWLAACLAVVCAFGFGGAPVAAQVITVPLPDLGNPCPNPSAAADGGGASNIVVLNNASGGDLQTQGSVQLIQIPGSTVGPVNCAAALNGAPGPLDPTLAGATCSDCKSLAVALQIDLRNRTATSVTPRNVANAQNVRCTNCTAMAIAAQYVVPVDDPTEVPPDAAALAQEMDAQLRSLQTRHDLAPAQAADLVMGVINQFQELASSLDLQRQDAL